MKPFRSQRFKLKAKVTVVIFSTFGNKVCDSRQLFQSAKRSKFISFISLLISGCRRRCHRVASKIIFRLNCFQSTQMDYFWFHPKKNNSLEFNQTGSEGDTLTKVHTHYLGKGRYNDQQCRDFNNSDIESHNCLYF